MPESVAPLIKIVLESYQLSEAGIHGVAHWARVLENGLRLAETTGTNVEIVKLFAVLHGSRRLNDGHDPEHGPRAAEFARALHNDVFHLSDHDFGLLHRACAGHTHERTHPDITIQTCWDADRLDLGRVGMQPHPSRLCTEIAKQVQTINWAHGRGSMGYVPEFVRDAWGAIAFDENPTRMILLQLRDKSTHQFVHPTGACDQSSRNQSKNATCRIARDWFSVFIATRCQPAKVMVAWSGCRIRPRT